MLGHEEEPTPDLLLSLPGKNLGNQKVPNPNTDQNPGMRRGPQEPPQEPTSTSTAPAPGISITSGRGSTGRGKAGAALSIPAPRSGHGEKGWRTTVEGWDGQRRRKRHFFLKFTETK